MAQGKGNGKGFVPVYGIPWKTFENFLDQRLQPLVEKDEVPPRIDRGFLKNLGGNAQTYLMSALRGFKLTDEENNVHPDLIELAGDEKARPGRVADLWRTHYSEALGLAESKSTHSQLEERWREVYEQSGDTMRKAITFFMHGAQYAGLTLSPHWNTTKAPSGPRAPRTTRRRRAGGSRTEAEVQPLPPGGEQPTHTVELPSGGRVRLSYSVNLFTASTEERDFILGLIDSMKGFEGKASKRPPRRSAKKGTPAEDQPEVQPGDTEVEDEGGGG